jgi:hypothetical protein
MKIRHIKRNGWRLSIQLDYWTGTYGIERWRVNGSTLQRMKTLKGREYVLAGFLVLSSLVLGVLLMHKYHHLGGNLSKSSLHGFQAILK